MRAVARYHGATAKAAFVLLATRAAGEALRELQPCTLTGRAGVTLTAYQYQEVEKLPMASTAAVQDHHAVAVTENVIERNRKAITLIRRWLDDTSGYDEETFPQLKEALEESRKALSARPPFDADYDVIIAAQAEALGAVVASENPKHLALFVDARHWKDID